MSVTASNSGELANSRWCTVSGVFGLYRTSGGRRVAWDDRLDAGMAGETPATMPGGGTLGRATGTAKRCAHGRSNQLGMVYMRARTQRA
jgi:hypothetical protein